MVTTRARKGETAQRIYKLLHRNPDLTTNEIASQLPDVSPGMVQVTVSRMCQRGELERRGKKNEVGPTGRVVPHSTYHVKYKSRPRPQPKKPKLKLKKQPQPAINTEVQKILDEWASEWDAPDVVDTQPVWNPSVAKPEPEGPTTPMAEREVLIMRHLTDIYKAMHLMTDQQDALIEVLKGTLADLAETKDELDRERQRRNWWDKLKGLF